MNLESQVRINMMGLYSVGPFTRIGFSIERGRLILQYLPRPYDKGTAVHCIQSGDHRNWKTA